MQRGSSVELLTKTIKKMTDVLFEKFGLGGCVGRRPAESGNAVFLQKRVQPGAAQTRYLTCFFDGAFGKSHQLLEILFFTFIEEVLFVILKPGKLKS